MYIISIYHGVLLVYIMVYYLYISWCIISIYHGVLLVYIMVYY